ncbi:MAG: aminodeoxychorismate/anthranilate synthase component II [Bacteroidia bacterium]|nr:aminodeoxychorismate/anthranilate synthase component II [Bacteroidia bacterium]
MDVLLIDNFDSFTYNLLHIVEKYTDSATVIRYDKLEIHNVEKFDKIIFSPGPDVPSNYKKLFRVLESFQTTKNILGVCLGHQVIAEHYKAKLSNLPQVMHGVAGKIFITDKEEKIFNNIPEIFLSGRYHSWIVDRNFFPQELKITAVDENENIMSVSHKLFKVKGIQFHPESILTEFGDAIISNWISMN